MVRLEWDNEKFLSPEYFDKTKTFIVDALDWSFNESSFDDLLFDICTNKLVLLAFLVDNDYIGCITGQMVYYEQKTSFRIITMGGIKMPYWRAVANEVEAFAKCLGCQMIEGWIRPDGVRAGQDIFGFKHQYSVMMKEV